ncbi:MAG: radical SAM protein [Firmicutes bacterium]|nr:radical SAM protein [Bacillota bacterium]
MTGHVVFVNPRCTLPVSVTGASCQLGCGHCGGRYLQHMTPISDVISTPDDEHLGVTSYLVSGGCSPDGIVPVFEHLESVRAIGPVAGRRINMHVGLVSDDDSAKAIGAVADVVSFDFVGSDSVIESVYGLKRSVDDYAHSFELLAKYCRVVPHICVGLNGGLPSGELTALRMVRELGAREVVLIVFIPTAGTRFADRTPPDLQYVGEVLQSARSLFADGVVKLGCMRPRGQYRSDLDRMSLDLGIDSIVLPHREAVRHAQSTGLAIEWTKECCAL